VPSAFLPSDSDRRVLQALIDAFRRGALNTRQRPFVEDQQGRSPDVYAVLTPAAGIPARSGDVPGSASCAVYRLLRSPGGVDTLTDVGLPPQAVYNLSASAVPGSEYARASRDKFGTWWADPPSGGDCPGVSFDETDLRCEPATGTGSHSLNLYRRTLALTWPGGCPSARLTPWTLVRAVACCDPACATGPPAVDCGTCVGTLPAGLCLNVYASAECGCWDGVAFDLDNANPAYPTWTGGQDEPQCRAAADGLPPAGVFARFGCTGATSSPAALFQLDVDVGGGLRTFFSDPATQNCSPLYAKFRVPMNTATPALLGCTSTDGHLDVVVTEPPCVAGTGTGAPGTGGGACGITDQGLGAADNSNVNPTAFLPSVTVAAGKLLLVNVSGTGTDAAPASVTVGGTPLTFEAGVHRSGSVFVTRYYLKAPPGGLSGNLVATRGAGTTALQLDAVAVAGLPVGAPSTAAVTAQGGGTAPAATITAAACSYTFAGAALSPAVAGSWPAPMTAGGQDDSTGGVRLTEAFRKEVAGGTTTATYSGVTPADWGLVLGNYV
jgi:hypothetical protein